MPKAISLFSPVNRNLLKNNFPKIFISGVWQEHIQNNTSVRGMLNQRGIVPENLPSAEDIKKVERKVKSTEKQLAKGCGKLPTKNK